MHLVAATNRHREPRPEIIRTLVRLAWVVSVSGAIVGDKVTITLAIEALKQPEVAQRRAIRIVARPAEAPVASVTCKKTLPRGGLWRDV